MNSLVGQQWGNYQLVRLLGRGGFAEVYLGTHVRLQMQAAIKILHAHLSEEDVGAFGREAQIIANLVHPHIVRVLDFDVNEGKPFLVLDYAPQGSLRQRYSKGTRVPLSQVVSYVKQVASALQYAHDAGLIHRDVKPENMLLGRQDEVLLSDFGIAAIVHSTSSMNTQGTMGTVSYMAPEQIQAYPRPASDQYALAVVTYHWLSGELPFQGSFTEIMSKHLLVPPPPLRTKVPTLAPEVEEVIMTALAKDHRQRFARVQAFATALEVASQGSAPHRVSSPLPVDQRQRASNVPPSGEAGQTTTILPSLMETPEVFPATQATDVSHKPRLSWESSSHPASLPLERLKSVKLNWSEESSTSSGVKPSETNSSRSILPRVWKLFEKES